MLKHIGGALEIKREDRVCPEHGPYEAMSFRDKPWSQCPHCMERDKAAEAAEEGRELERHRSSIQTAKAQGEAEVPRRFRGLRLESFEPRNSEQEKAFRLVKGIVHALRTNPDEARNVVFLGAIGGGKTHLAWSTVNTVNDSGGRAVYTKASKLMMRLKSSYSLDSAERPEDILDALVSADLLVLDEIGFTPDSDSERKTLAYLLDERWGQMRPTMVISNVTLTELTLSLGGQASMSRLFSESDAVQFKGEDQRGKVVTPPVQEALH
ncbi:ATP-binding protein [Thioalkalivibrio sp. ALMg11]|uniref:ATP-binding protein n=1 Tax=Thioalkalivibrio sp. ALMg11 TaxID=1158165 RepID=UPI000369BAE5|nr:ATP-binding protein [Thioalkalivibrio sp. ALMg11]